MNYLMLVGWQKSSDIHILYIYSVFIKNSNCYLKMF